MNGVGSDQPQLGAAFPASGESGQVKHRLDRIDHVHHLLRHTGADAWKMGISWKNGGKEIDF